MSLSRLSSYPIYKRESISKGDYYVYGPSNLVRCEKNGRVLYLFFDVHLKDENNVCSHDFISIDKWVQLLIDDYTKQDRSLDYFLEYDRVNIHGVTNSEVVDMIIELLNPIVMSKLRLHFDANKKNNTNNKIGYHYADIRDTLGNQEINKILAMIIKNINDKTSCKTLLELNKLIHTMLDEYFGLFEVSLGVNMNIIDNNAPTYINSVLTHIYNKLKGDGRRIFLQKYRGYILTKREKIRDVREKLEELDNIIGKCVEQGSVVKYVKELIDTISSINLDSETMDIYLFGRILRRNNDAIIYIGWNHAEKLLFNLLDADFKITHSYIDIDHIEQFRELDKKRYIISGYDEYHVPLLDEMKHQCINLRGFPSYMKL